jgi:hypothetical protein
MSGSLRRSRNISALHVNTYSPPLPPRAYLVRGLLLQFGEDVLRLCLGREGRHAEDWGSDVVLLGGIGVGRRGGDILAGGSGMLHLAATSLGVMPPYTHLRHNISKIWHEEWLFATLLDYQVTILLELLHALLPKMKMYTASARHAGILQRTQNPYPGRLISQPSRLRTLSTLSCLQ